MSRSFSPWRCVPWWIYLICVGLFAGTLFIGHLLGAQPVVEVVATANGNRVKAEVWLLKDKKGETSTEDTKAGYQFRIPRGSKPEYTVKCGGYDKPVPLPTGGGHHQVPVDFSTVTITFHAYDTLGRELKDDLGSSAYVYVQEEGAKWEQMPAPKTELKGTTRTVQFKCDDAKFDGKYKNQGILTAEVTWLGKDPHIAWLALNADLGTMLAGLDQKYDQKQWQGVIERRLSPQTKETTYDYPCLFVAYEHVGKGGLPPPPPPPPPPGAGGGWDDPIPYKTIQERHLTDKDVAGFDDEKLRRLVNNIFAHNGYEFNGQSTSAAVLARYKQLPGYKPTSKSQDDVKKQISNENEKYNLDFAINKRAAH